MVQAKNQDCCVPDVWLHDIVVTRTATAFGFTPYIGTLQTLTIVQRFARSDAHEDQVGKHSASSRPRQSKKESANDPWPRIAGLPTHLTASLRP